MKNICFIDFETTGTNVFVDEPIELGALLVDDNFKEINRFYSKIRISPNTKIQKSAYDIHNYTAIDLADAPPTNVVIENFFNKFGINYYLAGWNISFDVPYFRKMCFLSGRLDAYDKIDYHHLDVQSVVKFLIHLKMLPGYLSSLSKCAEYFQIQRAITHNALEDAFIAFVLYKKITEEFESVISGNISLLNTFTK